MTKIATSITQLVGNTPLLELTNLQKELNLKGRVLVKVEYFNATGSIKDRPLINMIEQAEKEGKIKPGDTIVDTTSGNTGISLTAFARSKGYKVQIILDPNVTVERRKILKALGADLLYYPDIPAFAELLESGDLSYGKIEKLMQDYADEKGYYYICQIHNENNPLAHYQHTGPEIWDQTDGQVDYFVALAGTGGTLVGVSNYLKEENPNIKVVALEPAEESRISEENPDAKIIDGVEPLEFQLFEPNHPYDEVIQVQTEDAYELAGQLAYHEGLFVGTSAAANVKAAIDIAKRDEAEGKTIVTVIPDNGFKYLSLDLYSE